MSRTRRLTLIAAAATTLAAGIFAVVHFNAAPANASSQAPTDTVKFEVGGNAITASNSAGVNWGTYVRLSSGWAKIEAASGTVICKIIDAGGQVLSEQTATGAGSWAYCSFTA